MKFPWNKYIIKMCLFIIMCVAVVHVYVIKSKKEKFELLDANTPDNQSSCTISAKNTIGLDYERLSPVAKMVIEYIDPSIITLPGAIDSNRQFSGECIIPGGKDKTKTQFYRLKVDEKENVCRPDPSIGFTREESDIELPYYQDGEGRTGCVVDLRAGTQNVDTLLNKLYNLSKKEVAEKRKIIDEGLAYSTTNMNELQSRSTALNVSKATVDANIDSLGKSASDLSTESTGLQQNVGSLSKNVVSNEDNITSLNTQITNVNNASLPTMDAIKEELKSCNRTTCNNTMQDWIVNKYWAFNDSANNFGECNRCPSRWFKAAHAVSMDGVNFTEYGSQKNAYNAASL
jgi:hypothetical protein